jgi:transcriptional regulator with XRE-family HTH domain
MTREDPALAPTLRRLRARKGITQEHLAFEAGVAVSALSRLERGLHDPGWALVRSIARALGVSMAELAAAVEQDQL